MIGAKGQTRLRGAPGPAYRRSVSDDLATLLLDARARTLALMDDLPEAAHLGPRLAIVNPPRWELGHVGWFQERWLLRREGAPPARPGADALYDSARVAHDTRWDLPLPSWGDTHDDLARGLERARARLAKGRPEDVPFARLALLHEDMHAEAFLYTRQTLGYPAPVGVPLDPPPCRPAGDRHVPGGTFTIGDVEGSPWAMDDEREPLEVELGPFRIASAPVSCGELLDFVVAGGYERRSLWSDEGWAGREAAGALHPVWWRRGAEGWEERRFDRHVPLDPSRPALHVNAFEAEAFCRFAGRRLPSEEEWEVACRLGGAPPERAVWEWTSSTFRPYPGFVAGPYREYAEPWFDGRHRVLRGGAYFTRPRIARAAFRNFYTPDRRDVLAGFRTCALP